MGSHAPRAAYFEQRTHMPEAVLAEYARFFEGCQRVLDVGCGPNLLKPRIPGILGLDISPHAKADVLGMVGQLPFQDGALDGVLAKDVLEHLHEPWLAVAEFHRVLQPGGKLRVEVPTPFYHRFWDDYTHIRPYTTRALGEMLKDQGFAVQRVYAYCGQGLPGFGMLGIEGAAIRINNGLAAVRLRRPTNVVGEAVKP